MDLVDKKEYYKKLREECLLLSNNKPHIGQSLIKNVYPFIRKYDIEIEGEENVRKDKPVLFVANHSNSHDIFTAYEIFSMLNRKGSVMVATDCLNILTNQLFNISNATLLDRRKKVERNNAVSELSNKIMNGYDGLIFGEGTWNLHPYKLMHNIHNGAAKISLITDTPIVPVIFEYIEKEDVLSKESELYSKCIIRFGKEININPNEDLSKQSLIIKNCMINIRESVGQNYKINKKMIDKDIYLNHTYIKKYKAFGFTYDSLLEQNYLLFLNNEKQENEYTLKNGLFVPGITEKVKKTIR